MPDPTPSIFNQNLDPNIANHQPLTPLTFLEWSATVYPDKAAVIYGKTEYTYREFARRCRLLASALSKRGIGLGDTVALMALNTPPMLEAHLRRPHDSAPLSMASTSASTPPPSPSSLSTARPASS